VKKTIAAAALAAMLATVAACGGSSSTAATSPTTAAAGPTSADRDRFVGTWTGNYGCDPAATLADKMIIEAGSGDLDLRITIHVDFANPDTVDGTLTSPTEVDVPRQSMGGASGTAKLTLHGETLEFSATGLGITCGGDDYTRQP
jgi:hypothetical protein